jgi:hypothetical protein
MIAPVSRPCQCPRMDVGLRPGVDGNPLMGGYAASFPSLEILERKRNSPLVLVPSGQGH